MSCGYAVLTGQMQCQSLLQGPSSQQLEVEIQYIMIDFDCMVKINRPGDTYQNIRHLIEMCH